MQIRCPHCGNPNADDLDRDLAADQTCSSCGSGFSLVSPALSSLATSVTGRRQIGQFELIRQIGAGASGIVWKAHDKTLDRMVAVKVSRSHYLAPEDVERFMREARAAARLRHPSIVAVHEVGREDGTVYIVSDYIDGPTLEEWPHEQGPQPTQAADLCATLADALHTAHEQGVVHRDIKPANILIDPTGQPHLTDFGLARRDVGEVTITVDGRILGTPVYMSPEQARGEGHQADRRTDIYSLGVILYQLLTGELPFRGTPQMLIQQVIESEPAAPREFDDSLPADLETICLKCLQKNPGSRYGTAAELRDDLRRYLKREPISARPVSRIERSWRWSRRNRAATVAAGLLCMMILGSVAAGAVIAATLNARRVAEQEQTHARVDALLSAKPAEVPVILEDLKSRQGTAIPRLEELVEQGSPHTAWRIRLGLLESDSSQVPVLSKAMLETDVDELLVIRNTLSSHSLDAEPFWHVLNDKEETLRRRFNSSCVLAALDPAGLMHHPGGWNTPSAFVVDQLINQLMLNPSHFQLLLEAFRPIGNSLVGRLSVIYRDGSRSEIQRYATELLAAYAAEDATVLSTLIADSNDEQWERMVPLLGRHGWRAATQLQQVLDQRADDDATDEQRNVFAHRRSKAAVALLRIGEGESVWPLLSHSSDPSGRTCLINTVCSLGIDPQVIHDRLFVEQNASVRRALLLILGSMSEQQCPRELQVGMVSSLIELYRNDSDPGVHATVEWVLQQWGEVEPGREIDRTLIGNSNLPDCRWYVNGQGQTLMLIPDSSLLSDSQNIDLRSNQERSFWLAAREVTIAEFRRFDASYTTDAKHTANPQYPVSGITWFQAAAYCNWLSGQEGISEDQWCFVPNIDGKYSSGMSLADDYHEKDGYRLPDDKEWGYACRTGTLTQYAFGDDPGALARYAWFVENSAGHPQPVGLLRPNDFGLFDMHGNLWEWTASLKRGPFARQLKTVTAQTHPIVRGGAYLNRAKRLRPTDRPTDEPGEIYPEDGFRIARTHL